MTYGYKKIVFADYLVYLGDLLSGLKYHPPSPQSNDRLAPSMLQAVLTIPSSKFLWNSTKLFRNTPNIYPM
jgi:phosphatidylinositol glycan class T